MALDPSALSAMIVANTTLPTTTDVNALKNFADGLAQAIVSYLKSNAVITGTVQSGQGAGGTIQGQLT